MVSRRSCALGITLLAFGIAGARPASAQGAYEGPAAVKAADVLPAGLLKGPHYTLGDDVGTPGYFHEFVIRSDYGDFPAEGTAMLYVRLGEVQALAALEEVSKSEVFLQAAGASVLNVGKSVGKAVTDPEATVKGIGAGVQRFGENLGRKTKKTAESAEEAVQGGEGQASDAGGESASDKAVAAGASAAKSHFGVTGAARRWAQKLGVDPYTSNQVLAKALEEIGKVDAAGGIAAKAVVPVPTVVSKAAEVSDLVWGKDPEELAKLNEQRLAELGVDTQGAAAFLKSAAFSPSKQTRFVAALHAVRATGCADYVETAGEASSETEAEFFAESAEMLAALHARDRVEAVLTDSRAMVARVGGARAVALLPLDSIRWTEASRRALTEIGERARKELSAGALEIRVTGRMSPAAKKEAEAIGWTVSQGVPGPIQPPQAAAGR
jgi:hypothetical protein